MAHDYTELQRFALANPLTRARGLDARNFIELDAQTRIAVSVNL